MKLQKEMCKTCPWRDNSPYRGLRAELTASAMYEATRICHSTGSSGLLGDTGKKDKACYGARQVALGFWSGRGFISAPTEEAWQAKCDELGIKNMITK